MSLIPGLVSFVGLGTVVNVGTVVVGSLIGMALGHRLPERTRDTVTDALGLVTLLIGALSAIDVTSQVLKDRVGASAPVLIVLGSLLIGGIVGSLVDLERRLENLGDWLRARLSRGSSSDAPDQHGVDPVTGAAHLSARERFIEGFVTASLIFCIGPLTILGSLSDGLGRGADQLILKAVLDGFASIAFAASLGVGVLASALVVAVVQGLITLLGFAIGDFLPEPHLLALTATGGLMLVGLGFRLLNIRQLPVGNLLPALLVAPLLVQLVASLR
ncbi:hypothetical protein CGZ93_04395 [Enemella dayhoffiae]|uniref:DUF554 domain-containing protein n=1 Tax=Enemella dayhoffiae TaxID=2016507 RepID=A0A255H9R0_9ACTN|nr:DUF554 domain-containing protein [Enemella dayhoffiae]OYO24345.1 hypothetical protein CGZ93_04395 [Enemella dayhoffiae]